MCRRLGSFRPRISHGSPRRKELRCRVSTGRVLESIRLRLGRRVLGASCRRNRHLQSSTLQWEEVVLKEVHSRRVCGRLYITLTDMSMKKIEVLKWDYKSIQTTWQSCKSRKAPFSSTSINVADSIQSPLKEPAIRTKTAHLKCLISHSLNLVAARTKKTWKSNL